MDGAVDQSSEEDKLRQLNGRMTQNGRSTANPGKQQADGDKTEPWYPVEYISNLDEDLWRIFIEELHGAESRSNIQVQKTVVEY